MRLPRIFACWLTLTLGVACGGSKNASPADAGGPSQGGAGGGGAEGTDITTTGGVSGVGAAAGTGGGGVADARTAEDGSTTAGGTGGTGGTVVTGGATTLGSLSSGGRTSGPQVALDAPVDLTLRPDAGRAGDAMVDTNPTSVGTNRCTTLRLGLGRASQDAIIVDVDGDGRLDLVTAEADSHLSIYRQVAARTFADPDVYDWPGQMYGRAVAAADLNQDGVVDFAMADENGRTGLLLSTDGGTRQNTVLSIGLAVVQTDIAIADFDRDGHLDIVVPDHKQEALGFWLGRWFVCGLGAVILGWRRGWRHDE